MKSKPILRRCLVRMGFILVLLMGILSFTGCFGTSDSGTATKQQDGSSNWDEMAWDKDNWS